MTLENPISSFTQRGILIDYLSSLMLQSTQTNSLPGDTPIKKNSVATGVFINGTLDEQRVAILTDLGNIPEVTVDFMLDHIVPNSGINVERTIQKLRRKGVLGNAGWKEFEDVLPKKSDAIEQKFFRKWELFTSELLTQPILKWDLPVLLHWS